MSAFLVNLALVVAVASILAVCLVLEGASRLIEWINENRYDGYAFAAIIAIAILLITAFVTWA